MAQEEGPGPLTVRALLTQDHEWLLALPSMFVHPDLDARLPLGAHRQPCVVGGRTFAAAWAFPGAGGGQPAAICTSWPTAGSSGVPTPLTLAAVKILSSEKWIRCTTKRQRHIVQQEGYSQYFIITRNGI